jgi:flagellar transcriptional activator FlhC
VKPRSRKTSVVSEARQIELAMELIELGARLPVLEAETTLSRERLLKLYKEVKLAAPPKGMLPFSADWFTTWQPNVHASLFAEIHRYFIEHTGLTGIQAVAKSYRLYLEHASQRGLEPILTFTRAWTLLRFLDSKLLQVIPCERCHGRFVVHSLDLHDHFVCGLCSPPSRAGKGRPNAKTGALFQTRMH